MFEFVVDLILSMGLADVTVIRGVQATTSRPRPTVPMPVIVEAIGSRYRINSIVTRARRIVGTGS